MCLVVCAWRATKHFPVILAANRDEFHDRPSAPANWWPHAPDVLGGLDLRAGGSWLAVDRRGRLATVTNVRGDHMAPPEARSRGHLVRDFLVHGQQARGYLEQLRQQAHAYAPFNLLVADGQRLAYCASTTAEPIELEPGIYGLSNAALDTPWPKVQKLKRALTHAVQQADPVPHLFQALKDGEPAEDDQLPDTGIELEWERRLSAPFIRSPRYGTRCSTVVLLRADGELRLSEQRFDTDGNRTGGSEFSFQLA
jgi:uncharacterized protein with NRDE domain